MYGNWRKYSLFCSVVPASYRCLDFFFGVGTWRKEHLEWMNPVVDKKGSTYLQKGKSPKRKKYEDKSLTAQSTAAQKCLLKSV